MKKLHEMLEVIADNEECIVLKVKEGSRMDLICLGYFLGDEEMIRLTRDPDKTITHFREGGRTFSWDKKTIVGDDLRAERRIIREAVKKLGIVWD